MTVETWEPGVAFAYDAIAARYDEASDAMYAPDVLQPIVDFLAELAPDGRALEFAIGSGRVALPLQARGLAISGIEISTPMVDMLRGKPGGDQIEVVVGDMAADQVPGKFDLVYLVYNTITCLMTQREQVACFANAARHLRPGGRFVIECFVPDLQRLPVGAPGRAMFVDDNRIGVHSYDLVSQELVAHVISVEGEGKTPIVLHAPHRYVWPSELDLMAELAGMRLAERWADWKRAPFTAESPYHVSVWEKPE